MPAPGQRFSAPVPSDHRAAADGMGNPPNPHRHRCHTFAIQNLTNVKAPSLATIYVFSP
jgi:hypothetical protein